MDPDPHLPFPNPRNHAEEIMNARHLVEQDRTRPAPPRPDGLDAFDMAIHRAPPRPQPGCPAGFDRLATPVLIGLALALLTLPLWL